MGIVSGGGGGTFNGGTITRGLDIEPTATNVDSLKIVAPNGQTVPVVDVTSADVGLLYEYQVDAFGQLRITDYGGVNLLVLQGANHRVTLGNCFGAEADIGVWLTDTGGGPYPPTNASAFYYNGTAGSGYLQVEAKESNGTLLHGSVPLRRGSGALPTVALVSGTAAQIDATSNRETITPVTFNPGAATTATCKVELSPDNVTYSTLGTETEPAGVAFDGTIHLIKAHVPIGYYLKLTVTNATLGTTTYY